MKFFLLSLLLVVLTGFQAGALQHPPPVICSPNHADAGLRCDCLTRDPGWCERDEPPPACCKRAEAGSKATVCGCCSATRYPLVAGKLCAHA